MEPTLKQVSTQLEQAALMRDLGALSLRVKKRPVVLFFGRPTFSDNSKYLYLRALATERSWDVYWCTADKALHQQLSDAGLPCLNLTQHIDVSIDLLLHAAVAVFCVNPIESMGGLASLVNCLDGARKVQLWHGVSVKRLSLQLISYLGAREPSLRRPWEMTSRADHVLSTSSQLDGFWRETFGARSLWRGGYPRNEVLRREPTEAEMLGADIGPAATEALLSGRRRSLLVVPTWQRAAGTWVTDPACLGRVIAHAQARGFDVHVKGHPLHARTGLTPEHRASALHALPANADIYPWLRHYDAVLTDYSSLMFDFLLTGKPVLRLDMPPDSHQSFEPDYSLIPPGDFAHVFAPDTLEATLDQALGDDGLRPERAAMAAALFETDPLQASAQLVRRLDRLVAEVMAPDQVVEVLG